MIPPPPPAPITWDVRLIPLRGVTVRAARLWVGAHLPVLRPRGQLLPQQCLLDTGAPLMVIPFHVHHQRLAWQNLGVRMTWAGQPCDIGRIEVCLHVPATSPRGPFPLLAKFAHSDPPGTKVPILLGLEFFLTHQASFNLAPPPRGGEIHVP